MRLVWYTNFPQYVKVPDINSNTNIQGFYEFVYNLQHDLPGKVDGEIDQTDSQWVDQFLLHSTQRFTGYSHHSNPYFKEYEYLFGRLFLKCYILYMYIIYIYF